MISFSLWCTCTLLSLMTWTIQITMGAEPVAVQFSNNTAGNPFGVVEVRLSDGKWGTICDITDATNNKVAEVVCAMMGYTNFVGKSFKLPTARGNGTVAIGISTCDTTTTDLTTYTIIKGCTYTQDATLPIVCNDHSRDLRVGCFGTPPATTTIMTSTAIPNLATVAPVNCTSGTSNIIKLQSSPSVSNEGLVVINTTGTGSVYGTICAADFGVNEAKTICRMLCSSEAVNAIPITGKYAINSTDNIVLSNLKCSENASTINDCTKNPWNDPGPCGTNKHMAVSVRCSPLNNAPPAIPVPIVECFQSRTKVFFKQSDVSSEHLISLNSPYDKSTCIFNVTNNGSHIIAEIQHLGCNGSLTTNSSHVIQRHYILKNATLRVDNVYADSPMVYEVNCAIPRQQTVTAAPLKDDVRTAPPITGGDSYTASVEIYKDYKNGIFSTPINPGDKVVVGTKVYSKIAVRANVPNVKLVVNNCWASDTKAGTRRINLISSKCPQVDTTLFTINDLTIGVHFTMIAVPGSVSTTSELYLFCETKLCGKEETTQTCLQICGASVRRRKRDTQGLPEEQDKKLINGPFILINSDSNIHSDRTYTSSGNTLQYKTNILLLLCLLLFRILRQ